MMFDSISLSEIPTSPFAAAGYTGGAWRTFPLLLRIKPQTHAVSIAVFPWEHAECLDVEPGDAEPGQAAGWVEADKRAGYHEPCLYSDWWVWVHELAPALKRARIALSSILRWVASYIGRPQLLPGYQADQWTDHCLGRDLDCSLVLRSFLAAARPPLRPPTPSRSKLLKILGELLGAHSKRDPRGHSCADPPHKHPWPNRRYDRACLAWSKQRAVALRGQRELE